MVRGIIPKTLKSKVLLIGLKLEIFTCKVMFQIRQKTSSCGSLVSVLSRKVHDSTLKTFLSVLRKGHVYNSLLVAIFVNTITSSLLIKMIGHVQFLKKNYFLFGLVFLEGWMESSPLKNPFAPWFAVSFEIRSTAKHFLQSGKSRLLVRLTLWWRQR